MIPTRRTALKTKRTATPPKVPTRRANKATALSDSRESCEECIAKLKFYHANRTPKGKQEFIDLLVDVLTFTASKHPDVTRRSLNKLSYKGKIRLKDTSKDELERFARAAYADTRFMSRHNHEGKIMMYVLLFAAVFCSHSAVAISVELVDGQQKLTDAIRAHYDGWIFNESRKRTDSVSIKQIRDIAINRGRFAIKVSNRLITALGCTSGTIASHLLGRSAFQKNASQLYAIIRIH